MTEASAPDVDLHIEVDDAPGPIIPDQDFAVKVDNLATTNANPANWVWPDVDRRTWTEAAFRWQAFTTKWRNATEAEIHSIDTHGSPVLDFGLTGVPNELNIPRLLIRDCYREAHTRIWFSALHHRWSGVILTGQPGIGKTIFIWYLLVCLLQKKQVILFHLPRMSPILFYHDQVYVAANNPALPTAIDPNAFIWSLFDVGANEAHPPLATLYPCFPVQAPSPNPIRYKLWQKERGPLLTGFPLWSRDEIARGMRLQATYPSFMKDLHRVVSEWNQSPSQFPYPGTVKLLERCFQDTPPASADEAFGTLLDAVIEHVGYTPREVFLSMRDFEDRMEYYYDALSVGYEELCQVVRVVAYSKPCPEMGVSYLTVCLQLLNKAGDLARWRIDFRSPYIAKCVVQRLGEEGENRVREMISFFSSLPHGKGASLARWFFEPLAHRAIMDATSDPVADSKYWSLQKMTFQNDKSPAFVLIDSSQPSDGFLKITRQPVYFESGDLPTHLEDNKYYIPRASNLTFFDAFVVQLNASEGSADLWLLQMTISDDHRGSAMGLLLIRKIIHTLQQQLTGHSGGPLQLKQSTASGVNVDVHYVLVRPKGGTLHSKWILPKDWDKHTVQTDHQGDGYLLEVPVVMIGNTIRGYIE